MTGGPTLPGMVLFLLATASSAMSHHAVGPVYDADRTITAEGVVTRYRLVNPHSMMTLESRDPDGHPVTWTIELDGRQNLIVAGWTDKTIRVGERITVYGNPTHTGSPRMFFRRLVRADGTELQRSLDERFDGVDEQRRERRRQSTSQN